ncbi:putative transcription factor B3-Domain family [Helianthus annuus]|nr:putative transcription factor B3-Domain family [Helianthus annuus]
MLNNYSRLHTSLSVPPILLFFCYIPLIVVQVLPKAYVEKNMSGPFVKKKLILRFDGRRSWVLSFKKVRDVVAITDGWKTVVDQHGLKICCLLNVKIGRSGNKLFFGRDWVKVVQQIKMKFATFVLFQYMGQRKFKLTVFMNDGIQLIVSHPQPNPNTAHDTEYPIHVNHQLIQQNDQLHSTFTVIARNRFRLPTKLEIVARVR